MRSSKASIAKRAGFTPVRVDSVGEVVCVCPKCPKGKSPKLYVNTENGCFICFRCHYSGHLEALTRQRVISLEKDEPQPDLALASWNKLPDVSPESPLYPEISRLLRSRGVSEALEEQLKFSVVGRGLYVVFPLYDAVRRIVGGQGRRVFGAGPRYFSLAGTPRNEVYYSTRAIQHRRPIVLVEGIFKAIAGARWEPKADWIAVLGTFVSDFVIRLAGNARPPKIVLSFDADKDGRKRARESQLKMGLAFETWVLIPPKDVDELSPDDPYWADLRSIMFGVKRDAFNRS